MRLLQLLSIGRCFGGVKAKPKPYKLATDLLPQFVPRSAPEGVSGGESARVAPTSAELFGAGSPGSGCGGARVATSCDGRPGGETSGAGVGGAGRALRRPRPARALPRLTQGELLLEQVQVVRNDLSEADVEVVCCGEGPRGQGTAGAKASARGSGWRWPRVAADWFGVPAGRV